MVHVKKKNCIETKKRINLEQVRFLIRERSLYF